MQCYCGAGFGNEDMEKPRFSQVMPLTPKRPYLLSPKGEQPVFQVRSPVMLHNCDELCSTIIINIHVGTVNHTVTVDFKHSECVP